ncbi:PAS domain S-box protein [bacterium]|nr:PAS domain S-box protein [bacterium]
MFTGSVIAYLQGEEYFEGETINLTFDGRYINILSHISFLPEFDIALATITDITDFKRTLEELNLSKQELVIRNTIANIFLTVPDEEMYGEVLDYILKMMDSKYGIFGYIDEYGNLVIPSLTRDIWGKCKIPDKTIVFPPEKWGGLWGRALREMKSFYSNDGPFHVPAGHISIDRFLTVPIIFREKVIGLLSLANRETDYTEDDEQLMETIAGYIAPILNARLQRDRQDSARKKAENELRLNKERYSAILNATLETLILADSNGIILTVNSTGAQRLNRTPDELIGLGIHGLFDDMEQRGKLYFDKVVRTGKPAHFENIRKGIYFHINFYPVLNQYGKVEAVAVFAQDITGLKQAMDSLRKSEERYRGIVENLPVLICRFLPVTAVITYVNDEYCRYFNKNREDLIGHSFLELVPEEEHELIRAHFKALNRDNPVASYEHMVITPAGERFQYWTDHALFDELGTVIEYQSIGEDITERNQAEEALRNSKRRLADIINFLPEAAFVIDREGKVIAWNRAIEELTGCKTKDILGKGNYEYSKYFYRKPRPILIDLVNKPEDEIEKKYSYISREGNSLVAEIFIPEMKGGIYLWGKASPLYNSDGSVVGAIETIHDITASKRAEEALKASEEKMRLINESSPIAIRISQRGRYVYANMACVRMYGYEKVDEILDIPLEMLYPPEKRDSVLRIFGEKIAGRDTPVFFETIGQKKSGERFDINVWLTGLEYQGEYSLLTFTVDTSSEKRLRSQLFQAQKMEAVGTLASGVAHDFNNLLQAVRGYAELLLIESTRNDPDCHELQEIMHAAARGSELTRQLLTFSRKVESILQPVDVNREILNIEKLLSRTIPKMIKIELNLGADLMTVNADPVQLEQVLMNLAVNAKDAMPDGGRLAIATGNTELDRECCKQYPGMKPGKYVRLTVSDSGCGMDRETMEHIFEPFYTTKGIGKGTGLGLAMVYGIIENHGGSIACNSEPGRGTSFDIYLPAIEHQEKAPEEKVTDSPIKGGSEVILLVDDEKAIREMAQKMLNKFGYTTLLSQDGEHALECYRENKEKIDLVILDMVMPGMGGGKCLQELLRINPEVRIIIVSGYSSELYATDSIKTGAKGIMSKPYSFRELLTTVRKILDQDEEKNR